MKQGQRRTNLAGWMFVSPFLLIFTFTLVVPILYSFWLSLFQDTLVGGSRFVGLNNYARVLQDENFWRGVRTTVTYGIILVPILLVASVALALLLDTRYAKAASFFRVSLFIPYAVPGVVAALLWGYLYGPTFGPLTQVAVALGFPAPPLLSSDWMLFSIANIGFWELLGYKMIIVYAALKAIPPELEEAALVDGSSTLQYAFLVKIPMVSSAILLNAIFSIIGTLQLFNQPQILKAMAPAVINNHYTPNIYARSLAFVGQQYNYAGAVSFLLAAIVAILSFAVLYLAGRRGRKSA